MSVQQAMEGLGALGQFGEVAVLERFGERVEQAPDVTTLKGIMTGLAPFVKHVRDQTVGTQVLFRTRAPAWPVVEIKQVLVQRRGGMHNSQRYLAISFRRRIGETSIAYEVEESDKLSTCTTPLYRRPAGRPSGE